MNMAVAFVIFASGSSIPSIVVAFKLLSLEKNSDTFVILKEPSKILQSSLM